MADTVLYRQVSYFLHLVFPSPAGTLLSSHLPAWVSVIFFIHSMSISFRFAPNVKDHIPTYPNFAFLSFVRTLHPFNMLQTVKVWSSFSSDRLGKLGNCPGVKTWASYQEEGACLAGLCIKRLEGRFLYGKGRISLSKKLKSFVRMIYVSMLSEEVLLKCVCLTRWHCRTVWQQFAGALKGRKIEGCFECDGAASRLIHKRRRGEAWAA